MSKIYCNIKQLVKDNKFARKSLSKAYNLIKRNSKRITGKNNKIKYDSAFLSKVKFDIIGNNNNVIIGDGVQLSGITIYIRGNNHCLIIGNWARMSGGTLWFEDDSCVIDIGKNTTIESAHIAVIEPNSKIEIKNDCMISSAVDIVNGDAHSILDYETGKRINYAKNIYIDEHVWIGTQVRILKGVTIGKNSVIGTRALVTKDVPENCVAAGMPAKVIKKSVTWDRLRIYQ